MSQVTKAMLEKYSENKGTTPRFLNSLFTPKFYEGKEIEMDIVRSDREIAIPLTNLGDYRENSQDIFTNKTYVAPLISESTTIESNELWYRQAGNHVNITAEHRAIVVNKGMQFARKAEYKASGTMELMSAQALTTGEINLQDTAGNSVYSTSFHPKASHYPTAGVAWAGATLDQMNADLIALMQQILVDSGTQTTSLIMGELSMAQYLSALAAAGSFDIMRIDNGMIGTSSRRDDNSDWRGKVQIGSFLVDLYTYNALYKDPVTGVDTPYIPLNSVVCFSMQSERIYTFGGIPNIGRALGVSTSILPELNVRLDFDRGMSFEMSNWVSPNGASFHVGVSIRPLPILTAIDAHGCLTTA